MKPLILFVADQKGDNEKITLTKTELEDMIEQAYQQGRSDGATYWYNAPSITTPPSTPYVPCTPIMCGDIATATVGTTADNKTVLTSAKTQ